MSVVSNLLGLGAILVTLFSMIQYLGFDLFGLLDGIRANIAINFISPLGNTAVYGRFLILTYPVILSNVIFGEGGKSVIGVFAAFLFGPAVLVANVDAGWIGFFVIVWCFAVVAGKRLSTWVKCIRMYAYICFGLGIWGIIWTCLVISRWENKASQAKEQPKCTLVSYLLWSILGSLIFVGPIVAYAKMIGGLNQANRLYNSSNKA